MNAYNSDIARILIWMKFLNLDISKNPFINLTPKIRNYIIFQNITNYTPKLRRNTLYK